MKRVIPVVFAALVVIVLFLGWALPSGFNNYRVRTRVVAAVLYGTESLRAACKDGSFTSKQKIADFGVPESDPKANVSRAELMLVKPDTVRVRLTLTDIYGEPYFLFFPRRKAISQGATMEFEYECSTERSLSTRYVGSTVEDEYLPPPYRARRESKP